MLNLVFLSSLEFQIVLNLLNVISANILNVICHENKSLHSLLYLIIFDRLICSLFNHHFQKTQMNASQKF